MCDKLHLGRDGGMNFFTGWGGGRLLNFCRILFSIEGSILLGRDSQGRFPFALHIRISSATIYLAKNTFAKNFLQKFSLRVMN